MRLAALALALATVAGCSSSSDDHPQQYRQKLKYFLSDKARAAGFKVELTDEDNRASPPTKYNDAARGVVYTMRHNLRSSDGTPVTMVTWVYQDKASAEAAQKAPEGWDLLLKDMKKAEVIIVKLGSLSTADFHAVTLIHSTNTSLVNTFQLFWRDIDGGLAAALASKDTPAN